MVTIIGYRIATGKDDKEFIALELQGDVELVQSLDSGNFYATARKASITSTFNEETSKRLIGTQLPGVIKRVESIPYDYVIPDTGEVIKLAHKYLFQPEGEREPKIDSYNPIPKEQFTLKSSRLSA